MPAETPREQVLQEAARLTTGDRNSHYGTPTQNFTNIAEVWTVLLRHKMTDGSTISAADVGALMTALKLCRRIASDKADNWTDAAGYIACGYEAAVADGMSPL